MSGEDYAKYSCSRKVMSVGSVFKIRQSFEVLSSITEQNLWESAAQDVVSMKNSVRVLHTHTTV